MICALDTETKGFDTVDSGNTFIAGDFITERSKKHNIFFEKSEMWNHIISLGEKEKKRKKNIYVYAHNHNFDFWKYADIYNPNLNFYSSFPFITILDNIYFLDTLGIYRFSLKKLGSKIGLEKFDTPDDVKDSDYDNVDIDKVIPYLKRDTEIVLNSVLELKKRLNNIGMKPQKIFTIGQVSINHLMNYLRRNKRYDLLDTRWNLVNNKKQLQLRFINTKYMEQANASRGGIIDCFNLGYYENCNYIDINSLYPYSATQIEMPNLKTETMIKNPLERYSIDELFDMIGISKCLILKPDNDEMSYLPVRYDDENVYPHNKSLILGCYTHYELKNALSMGYKIINIEWSVCYDICYNPFIDYIDYLYNERKNSDQFNDYLFKSFMNNFIGKLSQQKQNKVLKIDSVNNVNDYLNDGYNYINGFNDKYLYEKKYPKKPSKYYCVIIPALIYAHARKVLFDNLVKINKNNRLYSDTDSIIFNGDYNIHKLFDINENKLGSFKIIGENENCFIYNKKSYRYGNDIKLSGISKNWINENDFNNGIINYMKMYSIKDGLDKAGLFHNEKINLVESMNKRIEKKNNINNEFLFVDELENNISFFVDDISSFV